MGTGAAESDRPGTHAIRADTTRDDRTSGREATVYVPRAPAGSPQRRQAPLQSPLPAREEALHVAPRRPPGARLAEDRL